MLNEVSIGEIVANDTTQTLQKNTTKQVITVEFDKDVSVNSLKSINGVEDAILINGKTWKVISDIENDVRKELFNYAVKHNLSILTMNKEEQKLEDVFKALTNK